MIKTWLLAGVLMAGTAAASADRAGEALLQKCVAAEGHAKSLEANFTMVRKIGSGAQTSVLSGTLKLKRPNFAQLVMTGARGESNVTILSDGKTLITYFRSDNEFLSEPADPYGGNVARISSVEAAAFFNPDVLNQYRAAGTGIKLAGTVSVGSAPCKVLQLVGGQNGLSVRFYVGPDGLLHGTRTVLSQGGQTLELETRLTNVHPNAAFARMAFAWNPPKGVKPYHETMATANVGSSATQSSLLAVGRRAPDFQLPLVSGGTVSLLSAVKANKATLLNFWSYF